MTEPPIRWSATPSKERAAFLPILSPRPRQVLTVVALSEAILGVETHYEDRRTTPCTGLDNGCPYCSARRLSRWKGFVACLCPGSSKTGILEVTKGAADANPSLFTPGTNLRGLYLRAERVGPNPNGLVTVRVQAASGLKNLPPVPDLRTALLRIWGFNPPNPPA